jgi:hypothetical protein
MVPLLALSWRKKVTKNDKKVTKNGKKSPEMTFT